jgi:hypothetical protein
MLRHSKHVGKGLCAHPSTTLRMTALTRALGIAADTSLAPNALAV